MTPAQTDALVMKLRRMAPQDGTCALRVPSRGDVWTINRAVNQAADAISTLSARVAVLEGENRRLRGIGQELLDVVQSATMGQGYRGLKHRARQALSGEGVGG